MYGFIILRRLRIIRTPFVPVVFSYVNRSPPQSCIFTYRLFCQQSFLFRQWRIFFFFLCTLPLVVRTAECRLHSIVPSRWRWRFRRWAGRPIRADIWARCVARNLLDCRTWPWPNRIRTWRNCTWDGRLSGWRRVPWTDAARGRTKNRTRPLVYGSATSANYDKNQNARQALKIVKIQMCSTWIYRSVLTRPRNGRRSLSNSRSAGLRRTGAYWKNRKTKSCAPKPARQRRSVYRMYAKRKNTLEKKLINQS